MIHILIPAPALRDAIAEQLTRATLNTIVDQTSLTDALKDDTTSLIIVDEAALDKKTLHLLATTENNSKTLFVLGSDGKDLPDAVTEFFLKPLRLGHLLARIHYYLETAPRLRGVVAAFHGLRFESQNRQLVVVTTEAVIRLTEKETALLAMLIQSAKPVTREELLASIWGYDARIDTHTLESHIYQLRRKLDVDGKGTDILVNESGGYRLSR